MESSKVPLPSATESEQQPQTVFEKQSALAKNPQVTTRTEDEKIDAQSTHSESDNEIVSDVVDAAAECAKTVNLDEEFDKIVPAKIESGLLETDIDAIVQTAADVVDNLCEKKINDDAIEITHATVAKEKEQTTAEKNDEKEEEEVKEEERENIESKCAAEPPVEAQSVDMQEKIAAPNDSENEPKETREPAVEKSADGSELTKEIIAQYSGENASKPPVPIQTYLWEDIKRAKEQGGYPWTHLYKNPLGENEEPEVILTYRRSPKSGRRSESEGGTPKTQKKHTKKQLDEEAKSETAEDENKEPASGEATKQASIEISDDDEEPLTELTDDVVKLERPEEVNKEVKKTPKGILKKTQNIFGNMKPSTPIFDSGSLKKKIKTPIAKIKKIADDGITKVKSIKKTPSFSKNDAPEQEKLEILRLKESPKSQHRELASFIVKQDSDDTIDIVDLEQSPSESRKNRGIVTPDEIINLPVSSTNSSNSVDKKPTETDSCKNENANMVTIGDKRREHHYEDIEDYISKIAFDSEHVERNPYQSDAKLLQRQDNINDPIFDEFSRDFNRKIRKSLSAQDDSIRHELGKRIPKIEELEKQISDEDKEEVKAEAVESTAVKSPHLLAPISSIDSTSSDEDRKAQLSIVAEESETSDSLKKKSFDEPSVDIMDVESLQIDESDVSTLIDDEKHEELNEELEIEEPAKEEEKSVEIEEIKQEVEEEESQDKVNDSNEVKESPVASDESILKEDVAIEQNIEPPKQIKINPKWSKMSDHEYEPIGEPMSNDEDTAMHVDESDANESQKRTSSDAALEQGNEKKLLRIPTEDSEDNISAQDFQDEIESRFFRREIEPISDNEEQKHQEKTFDEAVIIDEAPVAREIPKKKSFIASASDSGKNFHKKIKAQASSLKTSINNKMKKKPKEKPVAVEVAQVEVTHDDEDEEGADVEGSATAAIGTVTAAEEEAPESITVNVQEAEEVAAKKSSKMSNFAKNIKKPTMPKFKKPQFKRPEMPKISSKMGERISNLRNLGRSKSMKESSTADDSTSLNTPEVVSAEPTKKKFDFGTYPRLIRDKFKRPKLPARSDRSMVSDSPARDDDFNRVSQSFAQRGPVASRWPEYAEEESGKYQHFDSETDLEREREHESVRQMMTEEQRQLEDMDRENLQIHLMAKQDKFRKPYVERQESDAASEDDKLMWSGVLNENAKHESVGDGSEPPAEEDFEPNALRFNDNYKFTLDAFSNDQELLRSCTPQTNQETQSSGSSGTRRRRGFLDDDDEYFLREQQPLGVSGGTSSGNEYIDSAIKEGLSAPDSNALVQMSHDYNTPERPIRSLKRRAKKGDEKREESVECEAPDNDYFKTYPPHRPLRKDKKSISIEPEEEVEDIAFNEDEMLDDASDIIDENELHATYRGIEHPDLAYLKDDFDNDLDDFKVSNLPVPPTPPRRRKKKIHSLPSGYATLRNTDQFSQKQVPLKGERIIVYHQEHVPIAQEEHFTTPTPTPRRTRSRSQISGYTLDDADSFKKDSIGEFNTMSENKENNDLNHNYATIKKEMPSRPVRRKRSTKSLGDRQFATLPLMPRRSDLGAEAAPPRPPRNYCTIAPEKPDKPPRRKSAGSLVEISKTRKEDDYEEILDSNDRDSRLSQRLKSGDVISKMKDRPLPPPPRPTRAGKKQKKEDENKLDKDDGAERIAEPLTIDVVDSIERVSPVNLAREEAEQQQKEIPLADQEQHLEVPKAVLSHQDSDFSEPERPIEVEVSTQTDPVPDEEFTMEDDDEDIDIEEFLAADGKLKTLEDILKEEQEAELERARQLQEAENLSRGIERFRESNQRSMSEKSRASGDRSRSLSRPITPSAVVVEMKKSSPIIFNKQEQIMTEAGLFIHPITYDDFGVPGAEEEETRGDEVQPAEREEEEDVVQQQANDSAENLDVNNNLEARVEDIQPQNVEEETAISPEPDIDEIIKQAQSKYAEEGDDEELDAEMQRKIEEMIESVMNSAREEAEWLRQSQENVADAEEKIENVEANENEQNVDAEPFIEEDPIVAVKSDNLDEAPQPPPRKSNVEASLATKKEEPINLETEEEKIIKRVEEEIQAEEEQEIAKEEQQDDPDSRLELSQQLSEERPSSPFPSRIHLSSLEIDSLSVSALQAGRITASEIDSHSIVTNEFECKAPTPQPTIQTTIEIPPGLIEEIVERVRNAERAERAEQQQQQQSQTAEVTEEVPKVQESDPPTRPPLPAEYQQQTTQVPASFYQLRDKSEGEEENSVDRAQQPSPQLPQQQHHHHRRRKHQAKKRDSTSDEDYQKDQRPRSRAGTAGSDQSVAALGGQFIRACGNSLMDAGTHLMEVLRASSKDENNRDLHVALLILIVIVAGLFLMGMSEKSVHHHHWDFFNPPENQGR